MIQRIQSVFLALLALAMGSVLFLPLWHKADALAGQQLTLGAFGFAAAGPGTAAPAGPVWAIGALAIASVLLAGAAIFQYRNRTRQQVLGQLNLLVITATLGAMFYFSGLGEQALNVKLQGHFQAGFYLPTLALLLNLLASRFIRRDEQLVRSMDRLR